MLDTTLDAASQGRDRFDTDRPDARELPTCRALMLRLELGNGVALARGCVMRGAAAGDPKQRASAEARLHSEPGVTDVAAPIFPAGRISERPAA